MNTIRSKLSELTLYNVMSAVVKNWLPVTAATGLIGILILNSPLLFAVACAAVPIVGFCTMLIQIMIIHALKRSLRLAKVIDVDADKIDKHLDEVNSPLSIFFASCVTVLLALPAGALVNVDQALSTDQRAVNAIIAVLSFILAECIIAYFTVEVDRNIAAVAELTPMRPELPFSRRMHMLVYTMTIVAVFTHVGVVA